MRKWDRVKEKANKRKRDVVNRKRDKMREIEREK